MTSGWPTWVPIALWSRDRRAHLRWKLRESKANDADRSGRAFQYVHDVIGPFVYHPADYLSRRIFLYDNFERAELQFAVEQARRGGTILDVGANIGLYTAACAAAAGERGHVIAIEPGPATFAKLTQTCQLLDLTNVTLLQVAAAGADGTAHLLCDPADTDVHQRLAVVSSAGAEHAVEVETRRLDDLTDPAAVALLKIDIEGYEVRALERAERILANGHVRLIVEFFPRGLTAAGGSVAELWQLLARRHRCAAIVRNDGTVVPTPSDPGSSGDGESWNTMWLPR